MISLNYYVQKDVIDPFYLLHHSETSTNSSGENPRYINISASAEDLRSNDSLKRHGLMSPFSDLDGNTSELDFYYGIGENLDILRYKIVFNGQTKIHAKVENFIFK